MGRRTLLRGALRGVGALGVGPLVWSLIAVAPASATSTGSITGTVANAGQGISGIEVYVYKAGTTQVVSEAQTGSNGSYDATALSPGQYDISYFNGDSEGSWLSGWYKNATSEASATPVKVKSAGVTDVNITIRQAGTITGVVTDPSGNSVPGIAVWAYPVGSAQPSWEGSTNSSGVYNELNLSSGQYDVSYTPSGAKGSWLSGWYEDAMSQASATPVTVQVPSTATVDITLTPGATIVGRVTSAAGSPESDVDVYAYAVGSPTVVDESATSSNGWFSERNLGSGSYDLYYFSATGIWKSGWFQNAKTQAHATAITVTPPQRMKVSIVVYPSS
jgi:hypothetical protein